jgi:hypothetical protein
MMTSKSFPLAMPFFAMATPLISFLTLSTIDVLGRTLTDALSQIGVGVASRLASPCPLITKVCFSTEAEQKAENRLLRSLATFPVKFQYEVKVLHSYVFFN